MPSPRRVSGLISGTKNAQRLPPPRWRIPRRAYVSLPTPRIYSGPGSPDQTSRNRVTNIHLCPASTTPTEIPGINCRVSHKSMTRAEARMTARQLIDQPAPVPYPYSHTAAATNARRARSVRGAPPSPKGKVGPAHHFKGGLLGWCRESLLHFHILVVDLKTLTRCESTVFNDILHKARAERENS